MKLLFSVICILISSGYLVGESQFKTVIPEQRQKEFKIEKALGKAVMSWLADGNEPAAHDFNEI